MHSGACRSLPRARSLKDVAGRAGSRLNLLQEEESGQPALRRSHSGRSSRDDDAPTPQVGYESYSLKGSSTMANRTLTHFN